MEIDDYNSEYFLEQSDLWNDYHADMEIGFTWNISDLEIAIQALNEIGNLDWQKMQDACNAAKTSIRTVINLYTEYMNGE